MKVLVTGGAGYIGSVTVALLCEAGYEVVVLDNLSHGHRDAVPEGVRFIEGNVGDLGTYITQADEIEVVVHLAAFIAAGESMQQPAVYWRNNTVETLRMLDTMQELDIKRLVFASTAAVYGDPVHTPILEDDPKAPTNTYGMTKLAIDMAITSETWAHGLAATSVRFFNVAGAYKHIGERHPVETHLIPLALQAAAGKRDGLTLYGTDYDTKDGTCIRDYIHVADLARAISLALVRLTPSKHSIYNLGNGSGYSNREVLAAVEQVTGKQLRITEAPRRPGDPAVLIASNAMATTELGWQPEKPAIVDIISDAWQFYSAQPVS